MTSLPRDARIGDQLPEIVFGPITRATLALFAAASGDHNPIHIDSDFARAAGQNDVFAHGMLSVGPLARVVTSWTALAAIEDISVRFLAITPVGATVHCRGEVTAREEVGETTLLSLSLSAHIDDGTQTLAGTALVRL